MKGNVSRKMPKSKIVRIIPDRIFYKLWKAAEKEIKIYKFIDSFTSPLSDTYIDFRKKCKLDELQTIKMLENIYKVAHLSVREIIDASGKKKAEIGYVFCIPIRTLEDWCSGKNKCPSYVRLWLIGNLELESEDEKVNNLIGHRAFDKNDYMMSMKEYEQLHVHNSNKDIQDIIAATDYLRDYMKK